MSQIFISKNNSSIIPLAANTSFVGAVDILTSYQEVDINIAGSPNVAPATLYFEFSPNGTNWDVSIPLTLVGPDSVPIILRSVLPYFRIRYVNGGTNLTEFRLTTIFHRNSAMRLTRFLSQDIDANEPIEVVRVAKSVLPDGAASFSDGSNLQSARVFDVDSGVGSQYVLGTNLRSSASGGSKELGTDSNPLIVVPNKYSSTGFGEIRSATPYTLIDLINKYEIDTRQYGTQTASGGTVTHISNESAIQLAVTASNGSQAKLRTNTFYRYQAGKEIVIKQSIYNADVGQASQTRRWGFYDDNDGLYWELNGTTFGIVRRTSITGSVVNIPVDQSSWNVDKMDGTGVSGITLDLTKSNIYEIHIDWLGVGQVEFFINGRLVHELLNQNTIAGPYMKTAQLPINFELLNTGASSISSFTFICASVLIVGGQDPEGTSFGAFNATQRTVGNLIEIPVLSIRPKATYNSITNRAVLFPFLASISTEGSRISYRIIMNASLTASSFTSADATSTAEFDVSATSFSGGQTLLTGFLANVNDSNNNIYLGDFFKEQGRKLRQDAFATSVDSLTISVINEAGGTCLVKSSISWKEVR